MAKKKILKLDEESCEPEELIVIINSTNKDYRMAYFINKFLKFEFSRRSDLECKHKNKTTTNYSVYRHHQTDLHVDWYLVNNKHPEGNLIPKTQNVDYLLIVRGNYQIIDMQKILVKIRQIPNTIYAQIMPQEKFNLIPEVLEMLELMILEETKREKEKYLKDKT
ncbi:MAG: IPExxxVDY family protein [Bacteroidales bacterium]|nr:IPExxxVDY family protein [Bacteroidales bacterium]